MYIRSSPSRSIYDWNPYPSDIYSMAFNQARRKKKTVYPVFTPPTTPTETYLWTPKREERYAYTPQSTSSYNDELMMEDVYESPSTPSPQVYKKLELSPPPNAPFYTPKLKLSPPPNAEFYASNQLVLSPPPNEKMYASDSSFDSPDIKKPSPSKGKKVVKNIFQAIKKKTRK